MKFLTKLSIIIIGIIILFSCKKTEDYSIIPEIKFKSLIKAETNEDKSQVWQLLISFTDGDGDIGSNAGNSNDSIPKEFFLICYQKINKDTLLVYLPDLVTPLIYSYSIPYIKPQGKNKNLKGEISCRFTIYPKDSKLHYLKSDTIAFKVYIFDRAKDTSNVIWTPLVSLK